MKELSIKEKAKRYDEALEKARKWHNKTEPDSYACIVESIFPELKESEDERIRKELINYCYERLNTTYGALPNIEAVKRWLAWLEKQDETFTKRDVDDAYLKGISDCKHKIDKQNKAIKEEMVDNTNEVESKFKIGDWAVWDNKISCHIDNICQGKESLMYTITDTHNMTRSYSVKGFDNNAHLWTIEDAHDGDLIYVSTEEKGIQAIFHEYKNKTIFFHSFLCCDFVQGGYMPIGDVELVYPLQNTHYKRFFEKIQEAGYKWDADKKELIKL